MFDRTSIPEAPWYIVQGNDKRRERLNCMAHILANVPYAEVKQKKLRFPKDYLTQIMKDKHYQMTCILKFLGVNIFKFRGLLLSKAS